MVYIINNISFKNELKSQDPSVPKPQITPELACVQDADRLDGIISMLCNKVALGAIGIARTFAYSGKRNRPLYDPSVPPKTDLTKEEYMKRELEEKYEKFLFGNFRPNQDTAVNHFYEKILKLKYMMKTNTGRKMADQRHQFLEDFLKQWYLEWDGKV